MSHHRVQPVVTPMSAEQSTELLALDQWAFPHDSTGIDPAPALAELEWERTFGARLADPDRLAGIYAAYSVRCPVPGGELPAAGLSWVGVHPRDRRRGVLTAMMGHHLADVAAHGEPFSLLYAAEPAIYGRFGYGLASQTLSFGLSRGAALRPVPGSADLLVDIDAADPDRYEAPLAACYDAARAGRPGWVSRDPAGKRWSLFQDPPPRREGAEPLRVITASAPDGELRGYALFRRRPSWNNGVADGTVLVHHLVARDAAASHALWSRLLDLDLTTRVRSPALAIDDPLLSLLVDARSTAPRWSDALWLRLVDLPAALAARRYAAGVDAVLAVTDDGLPANAGRWHLVGDRDGATCRRTDAAPDLTLGVRELGSAYLGGVTLSTLAAAGLVTATDPDALLTASIAFSWPVQPFCGWEF